MADSGKHIVIIGGSVAGLGAAMMLSQDGHRVSVLERDTTPLPASPLEAFERWDRRGAPQTRHSHAFLARLHGILRRRAPELLSELLAQGVEELRFRDMATEALGTADLEFEPADDEIVLLACRRVTFEWVLRRHVLATGRVDFRDGALVTGLVAEPGDPPRVVGVRVRDEAGNQEELSADLVIDAAGRRSNLHHWLEEIGTAPMPKDSEPCGIFYCSRFYQTLDGSEKPELGGVMGSDLGYMKYGIFPGDAGIFSITLCASPEDKGLRKLLRTPSFEAAVEALPSTAEWVSSEVSKPISDVHVMDGLRNTRCHFVVDGAPLALGVYPIGDALIHTNPLNGRGCTLAFVNAELVAHALREHPNDLHAFALALHEGVEREIVPWYQATLAQDRDGTAVAEAQQRGEDPYEINRPDGTVDPKAYMRGLIREGLVPAMREDLTLLRAFMRVFNLLEAPTDLMKDPKILMQALASYERRHDREARETGPGRDAMLATLASVA